MMAAPQLEIPKSLREFQARYPAQDFPKKTRLHAVGEEAKYIYLVVSGTVKISKISYTKQPLLSLVHSGELWAESLFVAGNSWSMSAETATKARIHCFSVREFRRISSRDVELMSWVASKIVQRLLKMERRLELMHSYPVEQRLMLTLADLASYHDGAGEKASSIEIPLTQSELASLVGATRETTSTILNMFARKGWIQLRRGAMYIPSTESLVKAAHAP
jgi:CRP/FNR family transcriptional regulator, cyclic AMP receptor protein